MNRTVIYAAVVAVFGFLLLRHRLLPLFTAYREKKKTGNVPSSPAGLFPAAWTAAPFLSCASPCRPLDAPPDRECRRMYFDYRIVPAPGNGDIPEDTAALVKTVGLEADQMLSDLHRRGITPAGLKILRVTEEHIMVFTTYLV